MIKSLLALAIFAALGTSVIALPAFAPKAKASEAVALAKADRLPVRSAAQTCFKQVWPDFATACLRSSGSGNQDRGSAHRYRPSLGDIPPNSSLEIIMPNLAHQNDVKIDRVHSDAICEEIGERLSAALAPPPNELPPRLLTLMDNLRRLTRSKS